MLTAGLIFGSLALDVLITVLIGRKIMKVTNDLRIGKYLYPLRDMLIAGGAGVIGAIVAVQALIHLG